MTTDLTLAQLRAGFGSTEVLRGVDLAAPRGRLTAVLGPSGCGKSTLLRVVAGFHRASSGTVRLGEVVVDDGRARTSPERRRVAIVPQDGALFPHLTALGNVEYGLTRAERRTSRARDMLELVGLDAVGHRHPHELSGGQQQRVAVARALAPRPAFVALDEPFSALDAHLREELRRDVRSLLEAEGATALLVTHDQVEALALADEVAVMTDGVVVQHGAPAEVYRRPVSAWVAGFVGDATLLDVRRSGSGTTTELGPAQVEGDACGGGRVVVRPEQVVPHPEGVEVRVDAVEFHGHSSLVRGSLPSGTAVVSRFGGPPPPPGATVRLAISGSCWALPA